MNGPELYWSEEGRKKLQEQKIAPGRINPAQLRAIVKWLKERKKGKPCRPAEAIYDKRKGIEAEDGSRVIKSKGFIYEKVLGLAEKGELDWVFDHWAVSRGPSQESTGDVGYEVKLGPQAFLRHWEDLRGIARAMTTRITIERQMDLQGFSGARTASVRVPAKAAPRRLWEDLRVHTEGHDCWILLKEFQAVGESVPALQKAAKVEAEQLDRKTGWPDRALCDAPSHAPNHPEPVKMRPDDDEEDINWPRIRAAQARLISELPSVRELALSFKRLQDVHYKLLDALASLELKHQFEGRCPDCPVDLEKAETNVGLSLGGGQGEAEGTS